MNVKKWIVIGLILSSGILQGQTDFRPGYVIQLTGDTLYGEIDYRGDLMMSRICKYKSDENQTYEFTGSDILAFRFIDSKYYISKEINGEDLFLEYLIKGRMNVYYIRDEHGDHYFIDKADLKLKEIPYKEEIRYHDDKRVFFESKRHIGLLNYYMRDAPELQSKINSINKPEHNSLIKIAKEYHNTLCDDEKCIIYEKKHPFIKVNFEVVAGVINFDNVDNLNDKFYMHSGWLANVWMPGVNEKVYFKTGFLFSQVEDGDGEKSNYVRIPIHFCYMAPNTYRIRPSFSIGILSPSYSGGIVVNMNKHINLGIQSWINFKPNASMYLVPSELLSYSLLGNFYFEF